MKKSVPVIAVVTPEGTYDFEVLNDDGYDEIVLKYDRKFIPEDSIDTLVDEGFILHDTYLTLQGEANHFDSVGENKIVRRSIEVEVNFKEGVNV